MRDRDVKTDLCSRCRTAAAPLHPARRSRKPVCVNTRACRLRCKRNELIRRRKV